MGGKKPFKLIGQTQKRHGNTVYGRIAMDTSKHKKTFYCTPEEEKWMAHEPDWVSSEQIAEDRHDVGEAGG